MVKLEELEDEHFLEKPSVTKDEALLADDDDDYTDTGKTTSRSLAVPLERINTVHSTHFSMAKPPLPHPSMPPTHPHWILADHNRKPTDSEISEASDLDALTPEESLFERITALKDIVPPQTRAKISNLSSSVYNATSTGISYGGKGLWVIATSVLLLGLPYALAFGDEQQYQEEERQRMLMAEGAQGMVDLQNQAGQGEAKAAL